MKLADAKTYMMKRGFFWGFLAALVYSIIPMGAPFFTASAFLSLVCPPVWFFALILGALPGAVMGFLLGAIYEAILARIGFPLKPISVDLMAFLIAGTAISVLIVDAGCLFAFFGNRPVTFFGNHSFNYAPYLMPIPFIAAFIAAIISYGYFTKLMTWYARYPYKKRQQFAEKKKNHETS